MIDEDRTMEKYGYYSTDLKPKARKRVVAVCDGCGAVRYPKKNDYRDLCKPCSKIGKNNPFFGKHHTEKTKKINSDAHKDKPLTEEHKHKISKGGKKALSDDPTIGKRISMALKKSYAEDPTLGERCSARAQGIPYEEWTGFTEGAYCEKFDEACRERIRAKYDNRCFLCGKPQEENIAKSGKQRALSVHHFDMNKDQGCNGNLWKLVPLCMCCHGSAHSKTWTTRIEYLLEYVWK